MSQTVKLSRNTAIQISNLTCAASTAIRVGTGGAAAARMRVFRDAFLASTGAASTMVGYVSSGQRLNIPYPSDDIAFIISWACTQPDGLSGRVLRVHEGDRWQKGLGHYDIVLTANTSADGGSTAVQLKRWLLGPLESARFVRAATSSGEGAEVGEPVVMFQMTTARSSAALAASAHSQVRVVPFKMPAVSYDT